MCAGIHSCDSVTCPIALACQSTRHRRIFGVLTLDQIKSFQEKKLESHNDATKIETPSDSRVIEWALVEIVILLTAIKERLGELRTEDRHEKVQS